MLPWSVTEKMHRDAEEMRAFYTSFGLSEETIERALDAKFGSSKPEMGRTAAPKPEMSRTAARRVQPRTRGRHVKKASR